MKKLILVVALFGSTVAAYAQQSTTAQQGQTATGESNAIIQPGAVSIDSKSYGADSVKTVGNAPQQAFGVSFSGDSCYSTAGVSGGWLGGALGVAAPVEGESCVMLRTYERLQQGAASETRPEIKLALKDASYETLAEISPKIRGILSRRGVIHGQAAVQYDNSGTEGMQPAAYRVEAK